MLQTVDAPVTHDVPIAVMDAAAFDTKDKAALLKHVASHRTEVNALIDTTGGILLRGWSGLKDASDFEDVLDVFAPKLMDYVGGTSPRSIVQGRVMTSTEVPATYSIPLHQEMSYTDGAPDRIAFFCQIEPESGGATTIADMRAVTSHIAPDVIDRFKAHGGLQLYRNLPSRNAVATRPGVPKPWQEVFETEDPAEAEAVVKRSGWRSVWSDDGAMRLWQEIRPATRRHDASGVEVWYNQVHIFTPASAIKWAIEDGRIEDADRMKAALKQAPDLVDTMLYGDGTPIPDADVIHIYDTLAAHATPHVWQQGDVLVLDNVLYAHGRDAFSGTRRILTALIRD